MNYLEGPEAARIYAEEVHSGQKRKGKEVPFSTHLHRVVRILEDVGASPEIKTAAWLHDSVEEGKTTLQEIRERFGTEVMFMVQDVTEPDPSLPWLERKNNTVERIHETAHASLLLKTADLIANTEETTEDYRGKGEKIFDYFNSPKDQQLLHKKHMVEAITETWPTNPLLLKLHLAYSEFIKVCNGK